MLGIAGVMLYIYVCMYIRSPLPSKQRPLDARARVPRLGALASTEDHLLITREEGFFQEKQP